MIRHVWQTILAFALYAALASGAFAWQQRVDYAIAVNLDTAARTIGGKEHLIYYNNSPNVLSDVYFHLYWNAFRPGSLMERHERESGSYALANAIAALKPDECGNVEIDSVRYAGIPVPFEIFGTIMRVHLPQPLSAYGLAHFDMTFVTHIPNFIRRAGYMSTDSVEYSMAQWYPKICEYDEWGWHNDQYLGREFYGVYGRFVVNITAPRDLVLCGTGYLTHPALDGCGYELSGDTLLTDPLRDAGAARDSAGMRVWNFEADDVHDFAWAADKDFVHQIVHSGQRTIHVLYKKKFLKEWDSIAVYTKRIFGYYDTAYGEYPYTQFTVVQAGDGGMEYPQIIFLRGAPGYGVLAHEMGHQWFYGLLGSNETSEAWLDEGFTTYATNRAVETLFGYAPPRTWLGNILLPPDEARGDESRWYLSLAVNHLDEPILEHSDNFRENATYGLVYGKTDVVLRMLQYVVGDSVFREIMKTYTNEFRLKHPSSEDFMRVCERVSGMRLDWFFYEWLRTNDDCDYALKSLSSEPDANGYKTTIALANEGKAAMPVDLQLTYADGTRQTALIPIGWKAKSAPKAIVLPQWALYVSSYKATFATPKKVVAAYIDTSLRLQDVDRLNNGSGFFPPMQFGFLSRYDIYAPLEDYGISFTPRVWYGAQQGMKIGVSLDGNYAFARYISHVGIYYNTQSRTADWWLEYHAPVAPMLDVFGSAAQEYGIRSITVGAEKTFRTMLASPVVHTLHFQVRYTDSYTDGYPFYNLLWSKGELNTAKLAYAFTYNAKAHVKIGAEYEAALTRQTGFIHSRIEASGTLPVTPLFDVSLRVVEGTSGGAVPVEKRFYLAGASPEEQFGNTLYRDIAGISFPLDTSAHILLPGGGDLPGYAEQYAALSGRTMLAASLTLTANLLRGEHNVSISGFGGLGYVSENTLPDFSGMSVPYADAGVSVCYGFTGSDANLLQSFLLTRAPLQIELSLPFFVSRPLPGESQIKMRWTVGISTEL